MIIKVGTKIKYILLMGAMLLFVMLFAACGEKTKVTLYVCGDDTMAILVEGDVCKKTLEKTNEGFAKCELNLETRDKAKDKVTILDISGFSSGLWWRIGEELGSVSAYDTFNVTENYAFATFSGEDIAHFYDDEKKAELLMKESYEDDIVLCEIDVKKIIKKVSVRELAELAGKYMGAPKPDFNWPGKFATRDYSYKTDMEGEVTIEALEGNIFYVSGVINDEVAEFACKKSHIVIDDKGKREFVIILNEGTEASHWGIIISDSDSDGVTESIHITNYCGNEHKLSQLFFRVE